MMNKANQLATSLLEDKFERAKQALAKIRGLRHKESHLLDELEQNIKIRETLAKLDLTTDDIQGLIPRGLITNMSGNKARRYNVDWTGAKPDDFVGAKLRDGSEVYFPRPIAPTSRDKKKFGNDPFAPSGTHRSTKHSNMVRNYPWGDFTRAQDVNRGIYDR